MTSARLRCCSKTLNDGLQIASIVLLENEMKSLRIELSAPASKRQISDM